MYTIQELLNIELETNFDICIKNKASKILSLLISKDDNNKLLAKSLYYLLSDQEKGYLHDFLKIVRDEDNHTECSFILEQNAFIMQIFKDEFNLHLLNLKVFFNLGISFPKVKDLFIKNEYGLSVIQNAYLLNIIFPNIQNITLIDTLIEKTKTIQLDNLEIFKMTHKNVDKLKYIKFSYDKHLKYLINNTLDINSPNLKKITISYRGFGKLASIDLSKYKLLIFVEFEYVSIRDFTCFKGSDLGEILLKNCPIQSLSGIESINQLKKLEVIGGNIDCIKNIGFPESLKKLVIQHNPICANMSISDKYKEPNLKTIQTVIL